MISRKPVVFTLQEIFFKDKRQTSHATSLKNELMEIIRIVSATCCGLYKPININVKVVVVEIRFVMVYFFPPKELPARMPAAHSITPA